MTVHGPARSQDPNTGHFQTEIDRYRTACQFTRDTATEPDYCTPMFRKELLFVCLLIASLVATTTLHARELPGVMTLECSGALHAEPDNESKSGSSEIDKGTMHHHGCHSASTFIAGNADVDVLFALPLRSYTLLQVTTLLPRQSGPGLRPPIV